MLIFGMMTLDVVAVWSPSFDSSVLELLSLSMFMPSLLVSGGLSEEINLAGTDEGNAADAAAVTVEMACFRGVCNFVVTDIDVGVDTDTEVDVDAGSEDV